MNDRREEESNQFDSEDNVYEITVSENQYRERLDQFLVNRLEKISRAQIQKLIKRGKITVDDEIAKPSHLVAGGEQIVIRIPPPKPTDLRPEAIPLEIIYEDKSLLVLNKQAGMVVHPAYGNLSGTLANALVHHSKNLSTLSGEFRPGLVHRLDKDTSGLLVVAKSDYVHGLLSQQFAEHRTTREYRALVWGKLSDKNSRIESFISRSVKDRTQMVVSEQGKWAITNYTVIEEFPLVSYVKLKLETGRTHQIRVHMSSIGHPVVGDQVYGGRRKQTINLNQQAQQLAKQILEMMPRQALHAKTLGFTHPISQQQMIFNSELPADMQSLIDFLSQTTLP